MIHQHVSARGVGFVRAWVFSLWVVYVLGQNPQNFADVPDLEFDPPGILKLLPDAFYDLIITRTGLGLLNWVLLAGLIACALGVRPWRAIAIPTVLLLTLHQGIPRGLFGYVNHKELGALYATYVLAALPATAFSPFAGRLPKRRTEQEIATARMTMLLLTAVLLIPYCLVGLYRVATDDISLWSSETFAHFIAQTSYGTSWFDNAAYSEAVLTRPWMLKMLAIAFPIGTMVEVMAPLCIVYRRFRYFWAASIAGLHVLTWATMDILFWENLALFPVLLVDGDYLLKRFDRLRGRSDNAVGTDAPTKSPRTRVASQPT